MDLLAIHTELFEIFRVAIAFTHSLILIIIYFENLMSLVKNKTSEKKPLNYTVILMMKTNSQTCDLNKYLISILTYTSIFELI